MLNICYWWLTAAPSSVYRIETYSGIAVNLVILRSKNFKRLNINRYKRGLETCPQANLVQSVQAIFFFFFPPRPSDEYDSAPSRNYTAHFGPLSPVSVNLPNPNPNPVASPRTPVRYLNLPNRNPNLKIYNKKYKN